MWHRPACPLHNFISLPQIAGEDVFGKDRLFHSRQILNGILFEPRVFREMFATRYGACTGIDGELVAPLVFRVPRMALEPMKGDVMPAIDCQEPHPEVRILHFRESLSLPVSQPALIYGFDDV